MRLQGKPLPGFQGPIIIYGKEWMGAGRGGPHPLEMPNQKVKALYEKLKAGVIALTSSEVWAEYLRFQSRFHRYSFGNALLIYLQKPDATYVAGYKTWQKMGRQVKKGEKGIAIFAPQMVKVRKVQEDSGEEVEESRLAGFRVAYVFDVST